MKNWMIIHSVQDFEWHSNLIGYDGKLIGQFKRIKKGDNILYYCSGDMVFTGVFKVISKMTRLNNDQHWGSINVFKMSPIILAPKPRYIEVNEILKTITPPLKLFPKGKIEGIMLKGRTVISLSDDDLKRIKDYMKNYKEKTSLLFNGVSNDEGLGEPVDLKVMNYAPTSEAGVVVLFSHFLKDLGFEKIEFVRQSFPDACVLERVGKDYHRKYIEFEYLASGFKQHVKSPSHNKIKCDYVVCWENDYKTCPVKVIELKTVLKKILNI